VHSWDLLIIGGAQVELHAPGRLYSGS
jgi:hypothetical protein